MQTSPKHKHKTLKFNTTYPVHIPCCPVGGDKTVITISSCNFLNSFFTVHVDKTAGYLYITNCVQFLKELRKSNTKSLTTAIWHYLI